MAASILAVQSAQALPIWNDGNGHEWRQLTDTAGLTYEQLSTQCAHDGATACAGSAGIVDLTGWTWATAAQVGQLFNSVPGVVLDTGTPYLADYASTATNAEAEWLLARLEPTDSQHVSRMGFFADYKHLSGWLADASVFIPLKGIWNAPWADVYSADETMVTAPPFIKHPLRAVQRGERRDFGPEYDPIGPAIRGLAVQDGTGRSRTPDPRPPGVGLPGPRPGPVQTRLMQQGCRALGQACCHAPRVLMQRGSVACCNSMPADLC